MTQHSLPPRAYVLVFATLIVLTASTVGISFIDLGPWHGLVGLTIAAAKATLVVLFFMHALHSSRLVWMVALSGLFWFAIMIALTLTDYCSRGWSG